MEDIPLPVQTHFARDGFSHESSQDIFNWVSYRNDMVESRVNTLKDQCPEVDVITPAQKKWIAKQKEIRGVKIREVTTDLLFDYSEQLVLKTKLSGV